MTQASEVVLDELAALLERVGGEAAIAERLLEGVAQAAGERGPARLHTRARSGDGAEDEAHARRGGVVGLEDLYPGAPMAGLHQVTAHLLGRGGGLRAPEDLARAGTDPLLEVGGHGTGLAQDDGRPHPRQRPGTDLEDGVGNGAVALGRSPDLR